MENSVSIGAVGAVSSAAGSHGMLLSSGHLLAVSVKNRSPEERKTDL